MLYRFPERTKGNSGHRGFGIVLFIIIIVEWNQIA